MRRDGEEEEKEEVGTSSMRLGVGECCYPWVVAQLGFKFAPAPGGADHPTLPLWRQRLGAGVAVQGEVSITHAGSLGLQICHTGDGKGVQIDAFHDQTVPGQAYSYRAFWLSSGVAPGHVLGSINGQNILGMSVSQIVSVIVANPQRPLKVLFLVRPPPAPPVLPSVEAVCLSGGGVGPLLHGCYPSVAGQLGFKIRWNKQRPREKGVKRQPMGLRSAYVYFQQQSYRHNVRTP